MTIPGVGRDGRKHGERVDPLRVKDWAEDSLLWSEMPTKPIEAFLGKEGFSLRARLKHKGGRSTLVYVHFPIVLALLSLAIVGALVTVTMLYGDRLGLPKADLASVISWVGSFSGLLIGAIVWLFHRSNLRFAAHGDLLAVTAGDETVTFQNGKISVAWGDLRAVTEVRGHYTRDDRVERIRQICVIYAANSGFRQIPVATVKSASGALAPRIAKLLHVPLLRGYKAKRRVRKRWRRKRT